MYKNPVVLGRFSNTSIGRINLQDVFSMFGNNTGNMLFSESLLRNIHGAERGHLGLSPEAYKEFDCIIVAAANWLNPGLDFAGLADRLEKTDLPVVAVGLGAQAPIEYGMPVLKEGTKRLINIISERSAKISVRGEFSASVLNHYGVSNVTVTGCPSLLLSGRKAPNIRSYESHGKANAALGATRHGFNRSDDFQDYVYRQARINNLDIILQSELADMYYATGRLNNLDLKQKAERICSAVYQGDVEGVENYLKMHAKVFFDLDEWVGYMAQKTIYVGTRLHGAIASLLAGTPAVLICHDSRTLEVAQAMKLPYVTRERVDVHKDMVLDELYSKSDMDTFEKNYLEYRSTFSKFFAENQLTLR